MRWVFIIVLICFSSLSFSQDTVLNIPVKYQHKYKGKANHNLQLTVTKTGFILLDKSPTHSCYGGRCDSTGKVLGWYEIIGTTERYGNLFSFHMDKDNIFNLILYKADNITVDKQYQFIKMKD